MQHVLCKRSYILFTPTQNLLLSNCAGFILHYYHDDYYQYIPRAGFTFVYAVEVDMYNWLQRARSEPALYTHIRYRIRHVTIRFAIWVCHVVILHGSFVVCCPDGMLASVSYLRWSDVAAELVSTLASHADGWWFESWLSQNDDRQNLFLLLPSLAPGINRIEQGTLS